MDGGKTWFKAQFKNNFKLEVDLQVSVSSYSLVFIMGPSTWTDLYNLYEHVITQQIEYQIFVARANPKLYVAYPHEIALFLCIHGPRSEAAVLWRVAYCYQPMILMAFTVPLTRLLSDLLYELMCK